MLGKIIRAGSIIAQANTFAELAKNATNITNPVSASVRGVVLIAEICAPPQVKYPIKCGVFLAQLILLFTNAGPFSLPIAFALAKQILEAEIKNG
jgi:hypothetical protein